MIYFVIWPCLYLLVKGRKVQILCPYGKFVCSCHRSYDRNLLLSVISEKSLLHATYLYILLVPLPTQSGKALRF